MTWKPKAGVFGAGVGDLIVKNTDSVFTKFDVDRMITDKQRETLTKDELYTLRLELAIKTAKEAEKLINAKINRFPIMNGI